MNDYSDILRLEHWIYYIRESRIMQVPSVSGRTAPCCSMDRQTGKLSVVAALPKVGQHVRQLSFDVRVRAEFEFIRQFAEDIPKRAVAL